MPCQDGRKPVILDPTLTVNSEKCALRNSTPSPNFLLYLQINFQMDSSQESIGQFCFLLSRGFRKGKQPIGLWDFSAIYRGKKGGWGETERSKAEIPQHKMQVCIRITGFLIVGFSAKTGLPGWSGQSLATLSFPEPVLRRVTWSLHCVLSTGTSPSMLAHVLPFSAPSPQRPYFLGRQWISESSQ